MAKAQNADAGVSSRSKASPCSDSQWWRYELVASMSGDKLRSCELLTDSTREDLIAAGSAVLLETAPTPNSRSTRACTSASGA